MTGKIKGEKVGISALLVDKAENKNLEVVIGNNQMMDLYHVKLN